MNRLHINIEYDRDRDHDRGWIVEMPQIYDTGIELEYESGHDTRKEAIQRAKEIRKNTRLPISVYGKNGKLVKVIGGGKSNQASYRIKMEKGELQTPNTVYEDLASEILAGLGLTVGIHVNENAIPRIAAIIKNKLG